MTKKRLGRGLDALLGTESPNSENEEVSGVNSLKKVEIELLRPGQYQPRKVFDQKKLQELAESIKAQGVIQPVLVRPLPGGFYEILAGERRVRAAKLADIDTVPVIVEDFNDKEAMSLALIENIQREDLNAIEEAAALDRLVKEFDMTHEEVARAVGRSRASVSNLIRLLTLPSTVKLMVTQNFLEMGHARALLSLERKLIEPYANKIKTENLSVRQAETLVTLSKNSDKLKNETLGKRNDPDVEILQRKLADYFHAKVSITVGNKGKGKIVINFSNLDELDGVIERCHLTSS